ncbi:MAG: GC-type dockerin domain-anchored protein [Phycisphaerales bacterium]
MSATIALLTAAGIAKAQQYTATIITPTGANEAFVQGAGSGHQVGFANGTVTGGNTHAFLWSGTAGSAVDLNPAGCDGGVAYSSFGGQQVGVSFQGERTLATLWTGDAASAVFLNPEGFAYAAANSTDGTNQVGLGRGPSTGFATHALAWTGTAESMVDIHPLNANETFATGVDGGRISGVATDPNDMYNACYWSSPSPDSFVLLQPDFGYDETTADAISGTTIGGRGYGEATGGHSHALLWLNGGETLVDIHPAGYHSSFIFAMRGNLQGGCVQTLPDREQEHAVVWSGTAESAVDLHDLIPDGPWLFSRVTGIDDDGNLYGYATNGEGGVAVRWTPQAATCGPADLGRAGGLPGGDGHLDNNDFIAFISHFFNNNAAADLGIAGGLNGHDGQFNNNDFIAFINLFFSGC